MIAVDDRGPPPPYPERFNLAEHVLAVGRDVPDRISVAILSAGRAERWSYAKLRARVGGAQAALFAAGLSPGDLVLFRMGNSIEMPVAYLACIASGILPVLSPASLTEGEVAKLIAAVSPSAILTDSDAPQGYPVIQALALRSAGDAEPEFLRDTPDRPAYVLPTSGTTSAPRLVVHAHRAVLARRSMIDGWSGLTGADRLLHAGAMNWS